MKIKDILTIDLAEDIKNVIDLEDISEAEIQAEIENYIVTDGLAKEYVDFIDTFTSNIKETGAWISGFYGSGKSYFAKILGYLLNNRNICGTPARDRILQRFTGVKDESLIKNSIAQLNKEKCRVVFLDIAKQDTSKGLSYTFFRNFLKSLNLPENEHGFLLYHLMINDNKINVYDYVNQKVGKDWETTKNRLPEYAKVIKDIFLQAGNSEKDYENLLTTIRRDIDQFGSARLREELYNYLQINKEERIIIFFDEASEAISQQKYNLLDLEGISESISSLGKRVWTIAIAQEKLDDVINNSSISKAQLTKVTDRFKTKIHLEASEIDVIIRNRLLNKKDNAVQKLESNYKKNSGKISDHAALNAVSIAKVDSLKKYITYYPFYEYQFSLLQNFLFGTKGPTSTKAATRGMIITTYDILKRELAEKELFSVATCWQIGKQAQPQPDAYLVNRYDNAEKITKNKHLKISGRALLETIYFLNEAEVVPTTTSNIIKSYIYDPEDFFKVRDDIVKALDYLVEAKVLLLANNVYSITTDIEQRLLDEMNEFAVQAFVKKKQMVKAYKESYFIKNLSHIADENVSYDFYINTDNDDELTNASSKELKIKLKSIYNFSSSISSEIEEIKVQYGNDKDIIWIVPDNSSFEEIDRLIDTIERINYLEDNYSNSQSEEGHVIGSFSVSRDEKEKRLKELVEKSLHDATAIYLYNTYQLNKNNWQSIVQRLQREVINNVYYKRLTSQLSDQVAAKVIKEVNNSRLKSYFEGEEFEFFDPRGNFIGENLKVVEAIIHKIKDTFLDGDTLARELEKPPTGFTFGTVISTVSALMRGGKIIAKYNGAEKFSWRDSEVTDIFAKAREFRKASFKGIAKSLSAHQRNDIVTILKDLKCEEYIGRKIDWNTNDYELANTIRDLANRYCDKIDDMSSQTKDFDVLFSKVKEKKNILNEFSGVVSESNYIDKAEKLITKKEIFSETIEEIEGVANFISNKLSKLYQWKSFVHGVESELKKSGKIDNEISELCIEFRRSYDKGVVQNYDFLEKLAQKIKDKYFKLMQNIAKSMADKYSQLESNAEKVVKEINHLPKGLNDEALEKVKGIQNYAMNRTHNDIDIGFDIKDKNSNFTYSEMLSFLELYKSKCMELELIENSLIKEKPEPKKPQGAVSERTVLATKFPSTRLKVGEYKKWLYHELQKMANLDNNDEVEIKRE